MPAPETGWHFYLRFLPGLCRMLAVINNIKEAHMPKQCLAVATNELKKLKIWKELAQKKNPVSGLIHVVQIFGDEEIIEFLEFVSKNGTFHERYGSGGIEENSDWQQIIFYALFVRGNKFFVYRRASDQTESRLASKISVGVGGHIEPHDADLFRSLYREIAEEVRFMKNGEELLIPEDVMDSHTFNNLFRVSPEGIIKDELDEVGSVHTGLLCVVEILDPEIEIESRDPKEIACGRFVSPGEEFAAFVAEQQGEVEGWTKLVLATME
jgi:predicted NUDIX family phosphoesterase